MKDIVQFLSVPIAVTALIAMIGLAGGIENGSIPFPAGAAAVGLLVLVEVLAYAHYAKEDKKNGKKTDE